MDLSHLQGLIDTAIETQEVDMTETGSGAGLMPEGWALARMCCYIEYGKQPQEFNGKAKAPADEIKVGFKLFGGENDCYEGRYIKTFNMALGNTPKNKTKLLFNGLNYSGNLKHIAQGLGQAYLVHILVVKNKAGKESNRIELDNILPPIDLMSKKPYVVPELEADDLRYFFFNSPTKETWESLFVDGQWDDGGSKNKDQETILTALNYDGSPLQQLLNGFVPDPSMSVTRDTDDDGEPEPEVVTPQVKPTGAINVAAPSKPKMPTVS